ncbi:MAG: hypothetical protein JXQ87_10600 [Bacteroidia bacterium]
MKESLKNVASKISAADVLIVLAGAGMSADSGIPVYRDKDGLWQKDIAVNGSAVPISELNTHNAFIENYELAWELTKDRIQTISKAEPHSGYINLLSLCEEKEHFVITTNIDSLFVKSNFNENRIVEMHGTLEYFQCLTLCEKEIWLMPESLNDLPPICPNCGGKTRPNIRLFEDWYWLSVRSKDQEKVYSKFLKLVKSENRSVAVIEIGAGTKLPYLRQIGERLAKNGWPIIRINPVDENNEGVISICLEAKEALSRLKAQGSQLH